MVAVMMRDQHPSDRLARRGLLNRRQKRLRLQRRRLGIDRHHVIVAHNQAAIRDALIHHARATGLNVRKNIRCSCRISVFQLGTVETSLPFLSSQETRGAKAADQFSTAPLLLHYVHLL